MPVSALSSSSRSVQCSSSNCLTPSLVTSLVERRVTTHTNIVFYTDASINKHNTHVHCPIFLTTVTVSFLESERLVCRWFAIDQSCLALESSCSLNSPLNVMLSMFVCTKIQHLPSRIFTRLHCFCVIVGLLVRIHGDQKRRTSLQNRPIMMACSRLLA